MRNPESSHQMVAESETPRQPGAIVSMVAQANTARQAAQRNARKHKQQGQPGRQQMTHFSDHGAE